MARRKTFSSPPASPMNQWARDAFAFAEDRGNFLTYDEVAAALTKAKLGTTYDKTMVQKMTTMRKISLAEAAVMSRLTDFPLPEMEAKAFSLDDRAARLSEERRKWLEGILADLEAAEEASRAKPQ